LTPFPEPREPWKAVFQDLMSGDLSSSGATSFAASLARVMRVLDTMGRGLEILSGNARPDDLRAPETLRRN
jgi:hypothetical protein